MSAFQGGFDRWKRDYHFKTLVSAAGSFLATTVFAIYNGFLGVWYGAVWNGAICGYYLVLVVLRGSILLSEKRNWKREAADAAECRRRTFFWTSRLLLFLNVVLSVPIALMVLEERTVNIGMIPAITMATYTTYKITMACVNIRRMKRSDNSLVRELRTINLMDALVSILTLQNTLIIVNEGGIGRMRTFCAVSSAGVFLVIAALSVRLAYKERTRK